MERANAEVQVHALNLRVANWREMDDVLSLEEKERRDRFYFERDRQAFTVCRAGLRQYLGTALGLAPRDLRFRTGRYGKPHLWDDALSFNLSHSKDLAVIAITELSCVGVDIEYQRPLPDLFDLALQSFSPTELEALKQLPEALQRAGFFACWSRKEAFIKAIGRGLAFPLDQFDVSLDPRAPAKLLALRNSDYAEQNWVLQELTVAPNYSGAVVTPELAELRLNSP